MHQREEKGVHHNGHHRLSIAAHEPLVQKSPAQQFLGRGLDKDRNEDEQKMERLESVKVQRNVPVEPGRQDSQAVQPKAYPDSK